MICYLLSLFWGPFWAYNGLKSIFWSPESESAQKLVNFRTCKSLMATIRAIRHTPTYRSMESPSHASQNVTSCVSGPSWQEVFAACQEAEDPAPSASADGESGFAPHDASEGSAADKAKASDGKVGATVKILANDEELLPTPFPIADCIGEMVCAEDFAIDPLQPFAPEVGGANG